MSASALFSLGTKAMTASYSALATTGHNISNANVAGYSRQQVELATAEGQFSGAGFFGKGVDVRTVTRAHDAFLSREAATAGSLAAMDAARLQMLRQLESVFPTGEQGVGHAAGEFLNAMVDLSARPRRRGHAPGGAGPRRRCRRPLCRRRRAARRAAAAGAGNAEGQRRPGQPVGRQHRRAEPAHRLGARTGPFAQRPARPARPGAGRAEHQAADQHGAGRRRHA